MSPLQRNLLIAPRPDLFHIHVAELSELEIPVKCKFDLYSLLEKQVIILCLYSIQVLEAIGFLFSVSMNFIMH